MIFQTIRMPACIATLLASSFIFAAAMPVSQQVSAPPASAAPTVRMPKELALPANSNTPQPVDITQPSLGELDPSFDSAAYRRAVKSGSNAMRNEDWANAAIEFQEALKLNPQSKEVAYNLGIAMFRQGEFAAAEKLFKESADTDSADLAAKSMFNEGNAIYANVVNGLSASAQPSQT